MPQDNHPALAPEMILAFIKAIYGTADHGFAHMWSLDHDDDGTERKRTVWSSLKPTDTVPDLIHEIERQPQANWYLSTAIGPQNKGPQQRLLSVEAIGVTALTIDIDVADLAHAKGNLPPTPEDALAALAEVELPPSITVWSGHGFQCWWLLREPWYFETPEERKQFEALSRDWQATIRFAFARHGWTVDSTHDLARVLRLPGTINRKYTRNQFLPAEQTTVYAPQLHAGQNLSDLLAETPHYNLSDFEDHLALDFGVVGGTTPLSQKAATYYADLTLDPMADPPREKHETLLINSSPYRKTWERKRTFPSGDDSASTYDLALANLLVKAGFSDQEIVDTCIAWRRKHGEDDEKKIRRYDYWTKYVLGKVRGSGPVEELERPQNGETPTEATARVREANAAVEGGHREAQKAFWAATTDEGRTAARQKILAALTASYGIEIERVIRLMTEPPHHQVIIAGVNTTVGTTKGLLGREGQSGLRVAIADYTPGRKIVRLFEKETWAVVVQSFILAGEDVDPGADSTMEGRAHSWLTLYLFEKPPLATKDDAVKAGLRPYFDKDGVLVVFSDQFIKSILQKHDPTAKRAEILEGLRAYGATPKTINVNVNGKATTRYAWRVQRNPVKDEEKENEVAQ